MSDLFDKVTNPDQKARDEWAKKIQQYNKSFEKFEKRGKKIVDRYRDERDDETGDNTNRLRKYNILWANTETLGPAVYAKEPKVEVLRRYGDKDPVARVASAILERAVTYEMSTTDFHGEAMKARDDYLLVARGTLWQRYEPIIERAAQDPDEDPTGQDLPGDDGLNETRPGVEAIGANGGPPLQERVIGENAPTDYVHWKDFLHGHGQTWKQVPWVGRRVLLDKATVNRRWPEQDASGRRISDYLSFTHKQENDDPKDRAANSKDNSGNLAVIYEFWDKTKFEVVWYSPDIKDRLIETVPDPLGLKDFFPCCQPLYATTTTDRLQPVPDYKLYQDQASELDILTQRIGLLVKAIAVRGMYDGSHGKLSDLLNERPENFMLPVDNWAAFAEKGGIKGITSFLPIDQIITAVNELQKARNQVIQDIYAITGISDIVRGASNPQETATAQQIKGQYANLRLNSRRDAMATFLRDTLRIKAEVICEHFDPSTLRKISGFDEMTEVQEAQKNGQDIEQLWSAAYQMLRDDPLRLTHLNIQTDSIIEADLQAEQQQRTAFLGAVSQFMQQAESAAQANPAMLPLIGQMLLWGIRGFKIGRELESSFEALVEQLTQQAKNPQPKPPSPEELKAQNDAKRLDLDQQKLNDERQRNQAETQIKAAAAQNTQQQGKLDAHAALQAMYEFEENIKLQREELMLKYGIQPMLQAAFAAHDEDATNGTGDIRVGPTQAGPSPQA